MSARVGDKWGPRRDPITGRPGSFHGGQDFPALTGTPIYTNKPLIVDENSFQLGRDGKGWGNQILVRDPVTGQQYRMAHLDERPNWKRGDTIPAGAVVGHVGSTGGSTGSHLHWEVIDNGRPRDPAIYKDATPVTWDKDGKGNLWNTLDKAKPDPNYRRGNSSIPGSSDPNNSSDPIGDLVRRKEQQKKQEQQRNKGLMGQDKRNNEPRKTNQGRPNRRNGQGLTSGSPWHQGHDGG